MATVLAAAESASPFPGPGPWGLREWCGALLYLALFGAALRGIWLLAREGDGGGEARP